MNSTKEDRRRQHLPDITNEIIETLMRQMAETQGKTITVSKYNIQMLINAIDGALFLEHGRLLNEQTVWNYHRATEHRCSTCKHSKVKPPPHSGVLYCMFQETFGALKVTVEWDYTCEHWQRRKDINWQKSRKEE